MNADMQVVQERLSSLVAEHEATAGMYVRVHGDHLILGRTEDGKPDDRVRLTRLASYRFGLSVKRHTGRWERTPFAGNLPEVMNAITGFMQHLVARY
jgi:hypothetical protein